MYRDFLRGVVLIGKRDLASQSSETYILVDGSNVVYRAGVGGTPQLSRLLAVMEKIGHLPLRVMVIVDASLRHVIDDKEGLEKLYKEDRALQAPAGREADDFLLHIAKKIQDLGRTVYILTNDMFPVRRMGGTIPRVTFLTVPIGEGEEWIFHPPLEALVERGVDKEVPIAGTTDIQDEIPMPHEVRDIDDRLMASLVAFATTYEPPLKIGDSVAFAHVAGFLHNQWDGDFCTKFGYKKAGEFAKALEEAGLVKVEKRGLPIYLVVEQALLDECEKRSLEVGVPIAVECDVQGVTETDDGLLRQVFRQLREERHLPTIERIRIKARSLDVKDMREVQNALDEDMASGIISKEDHAPSPVYWPSTDRWDAVDPTDPEDPYSEAQWKAFELSIRSLPSHESVAQTRYHLAIHLRSIGLPEIAILAQAQVEHMVQLGVRRGLLNRVETPMGPRISVPDRD